MFLHTLGRIRELDGLPGGTGTIDLPIHRGISTNHTIPFFCSGLHLQDVGSLANLVYRDVTHAEFAGFREQHVLDGRDYCNVTDGFLARKQLQLSTEPRHVHWKLSGKNRNGVESVEKRTLPPPTTAELDKLKECGVPWVMIEHWEDYPFAWGNGDYGMYTDFVDEELLYNKLV